MRILKDIALFLYWYPFRLLISILPLTVVYLIGVWAGSLLFLVSRSKKKVMVAEFARIFPHYTSRQLAKIIRGSFVNFCLSEIEILFYSRLNKKNINKIINIEGLHNLDAALAKGSGVLLLQAHLGAFQMVMPAIGHNGYTMNQISASATVWKDKNFSWIQKKGYDIKSRYEALLPVTHLAVDASLRPVYRALANNEIVGITSDGGGGKRILPVNFLGRKANFQEGVASIAERTGAVIVPAFILTRKWLKHSLVLHEPVNLSGGSTSEKETRDVVQSYASLLEFYVTNYPDHYGFTMYLRKSRAQIDPYPFFLDHLAEDN